MKCFLCIYQQLMVSFFVHSCRSSHCKATVLSSNLLEQFLTPPLLHQPFCLLGSPTSTIASGNLESTSEVWAFISVTIFKLKPKFICWHISWVCFYLIKKKLCTSGNGNLYLLLWWENVNEAENFVISTLQNSHLL